MAYQYEEFKRDVYKLTDINLDLYKERQMKRRIESLIARKGFDGFESFYKGMKQDEGLLRTFVSYLTINVSQFYRNPQQWMNFDQEIIPYLRKKYGDTLTIWSAACSTGDEPYSLVMALSKHVPLNQIHIIATDIDKQVLEKARVGLYNEKSIESVPDDLKRKYFTQVGKSYKISDEIKKHVEFREHNLLRDPYPSGCHLIVCRNVVIYFTEEAKDEIYRKFYDSLAKDGMLFIGSTEQIMNYRELNLKRHQSFFFQK